MGASASMRAVAEEIGVSVHTLSYWLRIFVSVQSPPSLTESPARGTSHRDGGEEVT